jgi:hypothetical protein
MPLHPNVRRCTHIQITGHRCGSPALKQEYFCYFHTRMIKGVQTRVDSQIHPVALIENAEAIQAAIMHMIDAVLKGTIDNKRANIVLKALHIAVRNSRNVYFHIRRDDMVREVPNYAEQYLSEHPELNPPEPPPANIPEPPAPESKKTTAEQKNDSPCAAATTEPSNGSPCVAATAVKTAAERRQNTAHGASRGKQPENHQATEERKRSCDPQLQSERSAVAGKNSLPSPKEKARTDATPPLTNRQTELDQELKKLEASIEGAMRGDWRDLRTVFNAIGLTPRKPPRSHKSAPSRKTRNAKTV